MLTQVYIHLGVAFAGLVSFLSPCVLPLVPPYLGYLGGTTIDQMGNKDEIDPALWRRVVLASVFFVLGFTTVFVGFGAGASVFGQWIQAHKNQLAVVAGLVIIVFGLHFLGVLRVPMLYREVRIHTNRQGASFAGAYVMVSLLRSAGRRASVRAGDCPDAGGERGEPRSRRATVVCLFARSGIPFVLAAVAIGPFLGFLKRFRQYLGRVEMAMGVLLILTGVLILTGGLNWFGTWMIENVPALARIEEFFTPKQLQTDILKEGLK